MKQGFVFMFFLVFQQQVFGSDVDQFNQTLLADQGSDILAARAARAALDDVVPEVQEVAPTWGEAVSNIQRQAEEMMKDIKNSGDGRPAPLSLSCLSSFNDACGQAEFLKRHYSREMSAPGPLVNGEPMIDRNFPPGTLPKSYFDDAIRSTLVELVVASHGALSRDEIPSPLGVTSSVKKSFSRGPSALKLRGEGVVGSSAVGCPHIDFAGLTSVVPVTSVSGDYSDNDEEETVCVVPPNTARQAVVPPAGK